MEEQEGRRILSALQRNTALSTSSHAPLSAMESGTGTGTETGSGTGSGSRSRSGGAAREGRRGRARHVRRAGQ